MSDQVAPMSKPDAEDALRPLLKWAESVIKSYDAIITAQVVERDTAKAQETLAEIQRHITEADARAELARNRYKQQTSELAEQRNVQIIDLDAQISAKRGLLDALRDEMARHEREHGETTQTRRREILALEQEKREIEANVIRLRESIAKVPVPAQA